MKYISWYRHPKTIQERTIAETIDNDLPKVRAKRNKVNLPSSWDDLKNQSIKFKSWKYKRKIQYKEE